MDEFEALKNHAVIELIKATSPEFAERIEKLWIKYKPNIQIASDQSGFKLEAGAYKMLVFNPMTMTRLWLLGFAAQKSFAAYIPAIMISKLNNLWNEEELNLADERFDIKNEYGNIVDVVSELENPERMKYITWPSSVPKNEGVPKKPTDSNGMMAFDLLCMSLAYCFLHEFKHIIFQAPENKSPDDPHEEEYECDAFAQEILLANLEEYSASSGYDFSLLRSKRLMAIALSSLFLFQFTPKEYWIHAKGHPPIRDRIKARFENANIGDDDLSWLYLSCILLSQLRKNNSPFEITRLNSHEDICYQIIDSLVDE